MLGTLPLMAIVIIIYNIVVYLTGLSMESQITTITLISGAVWTVTVGEPDETPTWIDTDGDVAVVGRERHGEPLSPVLVASDGTVSSVDTDGMARIWLTAAPAG